MVEISLKREQSREVPKLLLDPYPSIFKFNFKAACMTRNCGNLHMHTKRPRRLTSYEYLRHSRIEFLSRYIVRYGATYPGN